MVELGGRVSAEVVEFLFICNGALQEVAIERENGGGGCAEGV